MTKMHLTPDANTFSILINWSSKLGQMDDAESLLERMIACGLTPDAFVYDSLLKGYGSRRNTEKVVHLLHQMADKGVVLDSEITSTILICLCRSSRDLDIAKVLPDFSRETSKGTSITCNELLMKLNKAHPELQFFAAS
ncbi:hypothetical protein L6164_031293 [Bauhinia variegata]|nr:hypothetical protein L6164_031293 [Bauhinia variegata]